MSEMGVTETARKAGRPRKDEGVRLESTEQATKKERKFRIIIDAQDNWDKNNDVFTNDGQGNQFLIKRGQEVIVPEGVVTVLKNCIITLTEKDRAGNDIARNIPRFALRVLGEV